MCKIDLKCQDFNENGLFNRCHPALFSIPSSSVNEQIEVERISLNGFRISVSIWLIECLPGRALVGTIVWAISDSWIQCFTEANMSPSWLKAKTLLGECRVVSFLWNAYIYRVFHDPLASRPVTRMRQN
jgi:hypothetical protein